MFKRLCILMDAHFLSRLSSKLSTIDLKIAEREFQLTAMAIAYG